MCTFEAIDTDNMKKYFDHCDLIFDSPKATLGVCLEKDLISAIHYSPSPLPDRIETSIATFIVKDFKQCFSSSSHRFLSQFFFKGSSFRQKVWQQLFLIPTTETSVFLLGIKRGLLKHEGLAYAEF